MKLQTDNGHLRQLKFFILPFSECCTNAESLLTQDIAIVVREGVEFYCFFTSCPDWIMQMLAINSGKVVPGKNIMGPVCLLFQLGPT